MKITNENIGWWFFGVVSIILIIPTIIYGINEITVTLATIGILTGGITLFAAFTKFFVACLNGDIKFEIDLLKPFKSRRISPEEEDKQNK